ncbi:MAG: LPS-assembly protein LptD [Hydrogenophilus sp.]|nr:LPS-assembly protein LptD [Hydrogenophilus sp.]
MSQRDAGSSTSKRRPRGKGWWVGVALLGTPLWAAEPPEPTTVEREGIAVPFLPAGTTVEAQRIEGQYGRFVQAEGGVVVRRGAQRLHADRLQYDEITDRVTASGGVVWVDEEVGVRVAGTEGVLNLTTYEGSFERPQYAFTPSNHSRQATPAQGEAARFVFLGRDRYRVEEGSWTSCQAPDPAWVLTARELIFDRASDTGEAHNARLLFWDSTLIALPWIEFPLSKERRSGWLTPSFGVSSRGGVQVAVPYYFNLAPHYDATVTTRFFSKRGVQLGGEFRYWTESSRGEISGEVLPNDWTIGRDRALAMVRHHWQGDNGGWMGIDFQAVSDRDYFRDLSNHVAAASTVHLLQQGTVGWSGVEGWGTQWLVQSYQTLDRSVETPYRRLPEWRVWHTPYEIGFGQVGIMGTVTAFRHPRAGAPLGVGDLVLAEGVRGVVIPEWRWPLRSSWWFLEPRVLVHSSYYALDQPAQAGGRSEVVRVVPIASLDGGLFLEREGLFLGRPWVQTLEPRLFFRIAPYRFQEDLPLFDTDRFGFGFAQLFLPNPYTGADRVADGASVTAAVTSRWLEPTTGSERVRVSVGQRFYFRDPRVLLPGEAPWSNRRTDLLAEAVWQPQRRWRFQGFWQYDPEKGINRRFNGAVRYEAGPARVVGADYRYTRDLVEDVAFSGQWPLGSRWVGVGRLARSVAEGRWTEVVAGTEYDGGCWVGRMVLHRYALPEGRSNTALFVQLELNGLGSLGSDPLSLLRRSVPGYGRVRPGSSSTFWEGGW